MNESQTQNLSIEESNDSKKEALTQRTQKGFSITLWGALILLSGCITTMVLPSTHALYDIILYIPTTLGAGMVIYGFYCVFE